MAKFHQRIRCRMAHPQHLCAVVLPCTHTPPHTHTHTMDGDLGSVLVPCSLQVISSSIVDNFIISLTVPEELHNGVLKTAHRGRSEGRGRGAEVVAGAAGPAGTPGAESRQTGYAREYANSRCCAMASVLPTSDVQRGSGSGESRSSRDQVCNIRASSQRFTTATLLLPTALLYCCIVVPSCFQGVYFLCWYCCTAVYCLTSVLIVGSTLFLCRVCNSDLVLLYEHVLRFCFRTQQQNTAVNSVNYVLQLPTCRHGDLISFVAAEVLQAVAPVPT